MSYQPQVESNVRFPIAKMKMIEQSCGNGKCYLRLLPLLPNFAHANVVDLEDTIIKLSMTAGSNPLGKDLLEPLSEANEWLTGNDRNDVIGRILTSHELVEHMMTSNYRFGWEDMGGIGHITHYVDCDVDDEIFNGAGWASRYILVVMTQDGQKVGASTINLQDFMEEMNPDEARHVDLTSYIGQTPTFDNGRFSHPKVEELNVKLHDKDRDIERLNSEVQRLASLMKGSKLTDSESNETDTIMPNDSSTQIDRYERHFMRQGTVFDVGRDGTVVETLPNTSRPVVVKSVVQGYVKTNKMHDREQQISHKIMPINGLANPFKSERLGLLCHFHTAIDTLLPEEKWEDSYQAILWLSKHQPQTPSQELAYQMIMKTFDLKEQRVVANPFKFPFLEIGMLMSDDSLAKTFELLRSEYTILWFEEMKSLKVPSFHSKYDKFKEHKLSNKSKSNSTKTAKIEFDKRQYVRERRKQPSVFGF